MNTDQLWLFPFPAELSDETAYALYECLESLTRNFEAQYAAHIRRHLNAARPPVQAHPTHTPWDDGNPPF